MMLSGGAMVQSGAITVGDLTSYMLYTGYVGGSVVGPSQPPPAPLCTSHAC